MVKVGIDTLAVYTTRYALDLATLAAQRGIETEKFYLLSLIIAELIKAMDDNKNNDLFLDLFFTQMRLMFAFKPGVFSSTS